MRDTPPFGHDDDQASNPIRGIIFGVPIALALWAIIFALWDWLA